MIRALASLTRAGLCTIETLAAELIRLCDRVEQSYAPGVEPTGEPPLNTGPWSIADLEALRGGFSRPSSYVTEPGQFTLDVKPDIGAIPLPDQPFAYRPYVITHAPGCGSERCAPDCPQRERLDDLAHAGHGDRFADIRDDEQTREAEAVAITPEGAAVVEAGLTPRQAHELKYGRDACAYCNAAPGEAHTLTCENSPQPCAGEPASVTQMPRRATQCPSISYGPERYRCEIDAGHAGRHQRHSEPGADGFAWCETWADPPQRPPARPPAHVPHCAHCGRTAHGCTERPCSQRSACQYCGDGGAPCIEPLA